MHDETGNARQLVGITQYLVLFQERVIDEVMSFDAGQGQCDVGIAETFDYLGVRSQGGAAAFPDRPELGCRHACNLVGAGQAPVIGRDHVVALVSGDVLPVVFPEIGEQTTRTILVEPLQVLVAAQEDAAQHQTQHPLGEGFRIHQTEGRTP